MNSLRISYTVFGFSFLFKFEIGSQCVALASLALTIYTDKADLEFTVICLSASQMLGLKQYTPMPRFIQCVLVMFILITPLIPSRHNPHLLPKAFMCSLCCFVLLLLLF